MRKTIVGVVLAALVLPAAAAARTLDVEGPLVLKGKGPLRGELTMANPSETRAVVFGGRLGAARFVDLAGDLRVRCHGRGRSAVREDDRGHKVYTCRGRGGRAQVHGSHFEVQLVARRYGALIPEGVAGTLDGKFRVTRDEQRRGEPGQERERRPLPPADGPPTDQEIDELIDSISGGDG